MSQDLAVRDAMVAIFDADATIDGLTGKTGGPNMMPRGAQRVTENLPIVTYFMVSISERAGKGGQELFLVQLEAWADMRTNGLDTLTGLIDRAIDLMRGAFFNGQGLKVAVNPIGARSDGEEEDHVRSIARDFNLLVDA